MTHDELLADIDMIFNTIGGSNRYAEKAVIALRAVVELHKPQDITLPDGSWGENCCVCNSGWTYPCRTIQVIEGEI